MDFVKPLRRRRRQRALSCNVLFPQGGSTIAPFRGNFCAQIARDYFVLSSKWQPAKYQSNGCEPATLNPDPWIRP